MSKHALIVQGGWEGHTPKESAEVFAPLLEAEGFDVTISDTLDSYTDAALMRTLDLIIPIWTMGQITNEQCDGLDHAVRAGCGLAGFHGGMLDAFRTNTMYQWMCGGQWVAHPGNSIPNYRVDITNSDHPITRGLSHFTLQETEQYYCHIDPGVNVLCKTSFTEEVAIGEEYTGLYPLGVTIPYAWTRHWAKGKVFAASWGHTYKDFDEPTAQEIVRRGMVWAGR